jgi:MoaA/NifB/PqqE/SkfB family radical SAM enzyme
MDSALQLKQVAREVLFDVGIGATISPCNATDGENLRRVADALDLDLVFVIATLSDSYYNNADLSDHLVFSENQKKELIDFLQKEKQGRPLIDEMAYYYDEACKYLDGDHRRTMPCPFQDQGFLIDSDGRVHYCPNSDSIGHLDDRRASEVYFDPSNLRYRERVREERCPTCQMSCYVGVGLQKSFVPFFKYQIKRAMRHLLNGAKGKKSSTIR